MKRITSIFLVLFLLLGVGGCGNSEKQEMLLKYINEDTAEMGEIESELLESYGSVTGDNYSSDIETYTEFNNNTITLARELSDEAVDISFSITDDEILEVHRIYMDYSNKFLSAVGIMISAIENQDTAQISEANEKLNEANNLALDYKRELQNLAKKYNIEIQD